MICLNKNGDTTAAHEEELACNSIGLYSLDAEIRKFFIYPLILISADSRKASLTLCLLLWSGFKIYVFQLYIFHL